MASAKKLSHRPKSTSSLEARSSPYQSGNVEKSERDLNERLDLARRNSRSVASREGVFKLEPAVTIDGDVIEEEREIQAEAEAQLLRACESTVCDVAMLTVQCQGRNLPVYRVIPLHCALSIERLRQHVRQR